MAVNNDMIMICFFKFFFVSCVPRKSLAAMEALMASEMPVRGRVWPFLGCEAFGWLTLKKALFRRLEKSSLSEG